MRNGRSTVDNDAPDGIDWPEYETEAENHGYVTQLTDITGDDARKFLDVGIDTSEKDRSGTFIQKDRSVIHCHARQDGVEVMSITQARQTHDWLADYLWRSIDPAQDTFTSRAKEIPHEGYFIRSAAGRHVTEPVQACLYIAKEKFSQNVHNVVIAEPDSRLQVITGCATSPHLVSGLHVGVSEFYVKKGAQLHFTMIHDWGERVNVRPRTVVHVEEGGVFVSNYISLKPVGSLQMNPITYLDGEGAVARFNSVLVAAKGCHLDVGSRVVLNAPGTRAEIISRAIAAGGTIVARGELVGKVAGVKAHLECKGLVLKEGLMHAIPELRGYVPGVEMSHEAAVGKIDQGEIEYLMARGVDEDEAVSMIVRGFLNVDIEGLPAGLRQKIDRIIHETQKDMM
ncbi:SufB/SufD family protein [Desulfatitalea alkaliphila]|uniref:SufD family Fe-S cluster assembly protein n=1 Tax=Desulfatitalea alkaliphila TaxID=2929485 RepID=A0AA41R0I6_9BACT|nr:SufD family Fe-S cluster assembly protein [Desulfatitalea alkaliphila]MCJ8500597.1 SufD family Fe-S cluster assembly protein [Desulfatitalea alkaliphila]